MSELISRQKLIEEVAVIAKRLAKSDAQKALMGRVLYLIEHQPPADQWIPCSSGRLPIHNTFFPQKVFVTYVKDSVRCTAKAWLNMDGKWANLSNGEYFDEGSVVAWMPLPEPYSIHP